LDFESTAIWPSVSRASLAQADTRCGGCRPAAFQNTIDGWVGFAASSHPTERPASPHCDRANEGGMMRMSFAN
jgi:hypothetical protein